jgi:phosphatidylglycerophosphatase A
MRDRFVKFLATGFGVGNAPFAPGTAGSVVGVGYWWLLHYSRAWIEWPVFVAVLLLALWCCGEAASLFRKPDPPCVVLDEIVVMPLVFVGLGTEWWKIAVGFVWFRVFDIWKPPPVRQAQMFTGGLGIVLDDLLAALYACGTTHLVAWVVQRVSR